MKIKICGLFREDDIYAVNEFQSDYIGFIFYPKSKRYINSEKAADLKKILNKNIKSVGVFVNEKEEKVIEIAKNHIVDVIQLHGNEDNEYIEKISSSTKLPVIKAFKADYDLNKNIKETKADYILIDSYNENTFGGTGVCFDWGVIPDEVKDRLFLAGGINISNVKEAIKKVNPYCIDINSGVETNGLKDKNKIEKIIKLIKGYTNE